MRIAYRLCMRFLLTHCASTDALSLLQAFKRSSVVHKSSTPDREVKVFPYLWDQKGQATGISSPRFFLVS